VIPETWWQKGKEKDYQLMFGNWKSKADLAEIIFG
jgi:hypothetical protein